jgi:CBS domain-containing protein
MSRQLALAHVDHSLAEAAKRMREADAGALPVVDGDELVGDVPIAIWSCGNSTTCQCPYGAGIASDHKARCVLPIGEAAALMARARVRRLAVVDRDRELVGIVSLAD